MNGARSNLSESRTVEATKMVSLVPTTTLGWNVRVCPTGEAVSPTIVPANALQGNTSYKNNENSKYRRQNDEVLCRLGSEVIPIGGEFREPEGSSPGLFCIESNPDQHCPIRDCPQAPSALEGLSGCKDHPTLFPKSDGIQSLFHGAPSSVARSLLNLSSLSVPSLPLSSLLLDVSSAISSFETLANASFLSSFSHGSSSALPIAPAPAEDVSTCGSLITNRKSSSSRCINESPGFQHTRISSPTHGIENWETKSSSPHTKLPTVVVPPSCSECEFFKQTSHSSRCEDSHSILELYASCDDIETPLTVETPGNKVGDTSTTGSEVRVPGIISAHTANQEDPDSIKRNDFDDDAAKYSEVESLLMTLVSSLPDNRVEVNDESNKERGVKESLTQRMPRDGPAIGQQFASPALNKNLNLVEETTIREEESRSQSGPKVNSLLKVPDLSNTVETWAHTSQLHIPSSHMIAPPFQLPLGTSFVEPRNERHYESTTCRSLGAPPSRLDPSFSSDLSDNSTSVLERRVPKKNSFSCRYDEMPFTCRSSFDPSCTHELLSPNSTPHMNRFELPIPLLQRSLEQPTQRLHQPSSSYSMSNNSHHSTFLPNMSLSYLCEPPSVSPNFNTHHLFEDSAARIESTETPHDHPLIQNARPIPRFSNAKVNCIELLATGVNAGTKESQAEIGMEFPCAIERQQPTTSQSIIAIPTSSSPTFNDTTELHSKEKDVSPLPSQLSPTQLSKMMNTLTFLSAVIDEWNGTVVNDNSSTTHAQPKEGISSSKTLSHLKKCHSTPQRGSSIDIPPLSNGRGNVGTLCNAPSDLCSASATDAEFSSEILSTLAATIASEMMRAISEEMICTGSLDSDSQHGNGLGTELLGSDGSGLGTVEFPLFATEPLRELLSSVDSLPAIPTSDVYNFEPRQSSDEASRKDIEDSEDKGNYDGQELERDKIILQLGHGRNGTGDVNITPCLHKYTDNGRSYHKGVSDLPLNHHHDSQKQIRDVLLPHASPRLQYCRRYHHHHSCSHRTSGELLTSPTTMSSPTIVRSTRNSLGPTPTNRAKSPSQQFNGLFDAFTTASAATTQIETSSGYTPLTTTFPKFDLPISGCGIPDVGFRVSHEIRQQRLGTSVSRSPPPRRKVDFPTTPPLKAPDANWKCKDLLRRKKTALGRRDACGGSIVKQSISLSQKPEPLIDSKEKENGALTTSNEETREPSAEEVPPPKQKETFPEQPRLNLRLNRHGKTGDGPTFWGMWEDERSRMVYVSWLPRAARASDRANKKRCELLLKKFIGHRLGFFGLEKVLLFPPTSAHCKLLFSSERDARSFLLAFGGLEGYGGPNRWKADICQRFAVDIRDGIQSTKVKIIWADQTKNEIDGGMLIVPFSKKVAPRCQDYSSASTVPSVSHVPYPYATPSQTNWNSSRSRDVDCGISEYHHPNPNYNGQPQQKQSHHQRFGP